MFNTKIMLGKAVLGQILQSVNMDSMLIILILASVLMVLTNLIIQIVMYALSIALHVALQQNALNSILQDKTMVTIFSLN